MLAAATADDDVAIATAMLLLLIMMIMMMIMMIMMIMMNRQIKGPDRLKGWSKRKGKMGKLTTCRVCGRGNGLRARE